MPACSGPSAAAAWAARPPGVLTPAGSYALAAMRYMHQYAVAPEHLAAVAVAAREWARLNPAANTRESLTIEDVLASPMLSDPLHVLDCCLVTDGAGAVVVTTAEHARALGVKKPGGLSYCHPGMFGIFLIIEAVRQLRGECGARQVKNARIALINGTGGTLSSTGTCILSAN
jgi:acetyl-CoA acetyltransferase